MTTGDVTFDDWANTMLVLLDHFQQEWTREQWEAVRWTLVGLGREQIGAKLRVAHQNVTKRLLAADWPSFNAGFEYVRTHLELGHPKLGAKRL